MLIAQVGTSLMLVMGLLVLPAAQAPPPPASADLVEDVRRLAAAQTNEARFEALAAMLRERNLTFTVEPFTIEKAIGKEPRTEGRNVVVTIGDGADQIVVGAHYDAARLTTGALSQGAVDNGASSVILVRVADALRRSAPLLRVKVVWFDMEELGLLGSARYIDAHRSDRIVGMINFDVNGYGDTVIFGPTPRADSQGLHDALLQTCVEQRRDCVVFPQIPPGDDRSFSGAKIPALSVAVLPALEAHQLWLLMNAKGSGLAQGFVPPILRTIHTPEDAPAKLDAETMAGMVRLATSLVGRVAAGEQRPPR